jgi:hypothetical protein
VIAKPTVFVLGAGASAPYGFPTAEGLLDVVYATTSADSILRTVLMECDFSEHEILTFCRRVKASGQDSIDAFLEREPSFLRVGKASIAVQLLPQEFNQFAWDPMEDGDWYRYLFARMVPRDRAAFANNRLQIITFNFDRSFEWRLARVLRATYGVNLDEAVTLGASIEVIHVHGQLAGDMPSIERDNIARTDPPTAQEVLACIDQMRLSSEPSAGPDVEKASQWLQQAEVICFLGFGFNTDNLNKLHASGLGNKALHGTRHKMSESDTALAYEYLNSPRQGYLLDATVRRFFDIVNVFSR